MFIQLFKNVISVKLDQNIIIFNNYLCFSIVNCFEILALGFSFMLI